MLHAAGRKHPLGDVYGSDSSDNEEQRPNNRRRAGSDDGDAFARGAAQAAPATAGGASAGAADAGGGSSTGLSAEDLATKARFEAEPHSLGCEDFGPLEFATLRGNLEQVKNLYNNGIYQDLGLALDLAAMFGHLPIIRFLVSKRVDINRRKSTVLTTPLMTAAIYEQEKCVRELLRLGANPNLKDFEGCKASDDDMTENSTIKAMLIAAERSFGNSASGSSTGLSAEDLATKAEFDSTYGWANAGVLEYATLRGNLEQVRDRMINRAHYRITDENLWNSLKLAAMFGHCEIIRFFVNECHVDVNSQDSSNNETVLFTAAEYNQEAALTTLLALGANPTIKDVFGDRASGTEGASEGIKAILVTAETAWETTHAAPGAPATAGGASAQTAAAPGGGE